MKGELQTEFDFKWSYRLDQSYCLYDFVCAMQNCFPQNIVKGRIHDDYSKSDYIKFKYKIIVSGKKKLADEFLSYMINFNTEKYQSEMFYNDKKMLFRFLLSIKKESDRLGFDHIGNFLAIKQILVSEFFDVSIRTKAKAMHVSPKFFK